MNLIILTILIIGILVTIWNAGVWGMIVSSLMAIILIRSLTGKDNFY